MRSHLGPPPSAFGTILSVWAHPDDETYLAGATMALARQAGCRVVCATASAGELGTSDPDAWPPARLAAVRRWEHAAAMAVLGVVEHHVRGLPDGGLGEQGDAGREWVRSLVDEVEPDTVLTFGRDGMTFHADHVAVHHWVTDVWEERGRPFRLLQATPTTEHLARFGALYEDWQMYMTDERPAGTPERDAAVLVRAEGELLDRKLTALRAMATQTAPLVAAIDPQVLADEVAVEAFVDAAALAPASPLRLAGAVRA